MGIKIRMSSHFKVKPSFWLTRILAAVFFVFASLSSRPASAQIFCELPILPPIATVLMVVANNLLIDAALSPNSAPLPRLMNEVTQTTMSLTAGDVGVGATAGLGGSIGIPGMKELIGNIPIPGLDSALNMAFQSNFYGGLGFMDDLMRIRLDKFWNDWFGGLRGMSAQIYASGINTARMIASLDDAGGMSAAALLHQKEEMKARRDHTVTAEACQHDSMARGQSYARDVTESMKVAFAQEYNDISTNKLGSVGATGPADFHRNRYQTYVEKFCDPDVNGGNSPCAGQPKGPLAGATVTPSVTLFSHMTLPVDSNPDLLTALNMMCDNITGYSPPPVVPKQALTTQKGIELDQKNRQYAARMDLIRSLCTDLVAQRMPSQDQNNPGEGANAQAILLKAGLSKASPTPSEYERLYAEVVKRRLPEFSANMGDPGSNVGQEIVRTAALLTKLGYMRFLTLEKILAAEAVLGSLDLEAIKRTGNAMAHVPKQ